MNDWMWTRNQSASQALCQSISQLVCFLERLVPSGTFQILIHFVRTRYIGQTRDTTVHGSRHVNQEINRRENPIVLWIGFSLFMRVSNV